MPNPALSLNNTGLTNPCSCKYFKLKSETNKSNKKRILIKDYLKNAQKI